MTFTKVMTGVALAVMLSAYAPAQGPTSTCEDQLIDSQQKLSSLLDANAKTFELSVKVLRDACKTQQCTQLAQSMETVGKQDRKTAELIRTITEAEVKAKQ
jgi:hypothetical protein